IFRFDGGGRIAEYPGNYSAFLESREREAAEAANAAGPTPPPAASVKTSSAPRRLSYKERREFEELEKGIESAQPRKGGIQRQLAASQSDFVIVQALYAELESLNQQLERDVDRWAELAEFA